jgi:hypothetical protein
VSVSTIDGTLETFELKRETPSHSIYRDLVIRRDSGGEMVLKKAVVPRKVANALEPGRRGRFYCYEAIDHKGIHGVRLDDGSEVHAFPTMNERVMLLVLVLNCVLLIGRIAIEGRIWYLPLALVVLAAVAYPLYRKTHLEARRQFEEDSNYIPRAREPNSLGSATPRPV